MIDVVLFLGSLAAALLIGVRLGSRWARVSADVDQQCADFRRDVDINNAADASDDHQ